MSADGVNQAYLELLTLKELRKSRKLHEPGHDMNHAYGKLIGRDMEGAGEGLIFVIQHLKYDSRQQLEIAYSNSG